MGVLSRPGSRFSQNFDSTRRARASKCSYSSGEDAVGRLRVRVCSKAAKGTSPPNKIVAVVEVKCVEICVPGTFQGSEHYENMEKIENKLRSGASLRRVLARHTSNLPYDPCRHTNGKWADGSSRVVFRTYVSKSRDNTPRPLQGTTFWPKCIIFRYILGGGVGSRGCFPVHIHAHTPDPRFHHHMSYFRAPGGVVVLLSAGAARHGTLLF